LAIHKPQGATKRHALDWNPLGTRKRGRQKNLENNKRIGSAEGRRKLERSKTTSLG